MPGIIMAAVHPARSCSALDRAVALILEPEVPAKGIRSRYRLVGAADVQG